MTIDLNSDLGEGAGQDEEILSLVSSANISCGFHAGTPASIFASILTAAKHGVAAGAHPSFDDRENFGRREMQRAPEEVFALMIYQLGAFDALCRAAGVPMRHVKPHGALYNMSARDPILAQAVVRAIAQFDPRLMVFAPPASALQRAAGAAGLRSVAEVFADRNYNADGSLVSRTRPDALLHDPAAAAARVLRILREGTVLGIDGSEVALAAETICVHGDTPGAVAFVRALRQRLESEGVSIAAPARVP